LQINNNNNTKLFTANGELMQVEGEADIVLRSNSASSRTKALVSPQMKHTVLVTLFD